MLRRAVEVISPGSVRNDRDRKRNLYQRTVPEYRIVDLDACLVERWRPSDERPAILRERVTWQPADAGHVYDVGLDPFFAKVFGEPG